MGENTKIEWADHTASFWEGCAKIAPGCANCYAEAYERRMGRDIWGKLKPRKWTKTGPALIHSLNAKAKAAGRIDTVFINDLADFFEDHDGSVVDHKGNRLGKTWLEDMTGDRSLHIGQFSSHAGFRPLTISDLRSEAFRLFDECQNLIFQLLTKRPENVFSMWPVRCNPNCPRCSGDGCDSTEWVPGRHPLRMDPDPCKLCVRRNNVWLGCSVSDQATADKSIPALLECREIVPVLFVSVEPLLGAVDLSRLRTRIGGSYNDSLSGRACHSQGPEDYGGPSLDWVIVGGESGPRARPCNISWIVDIVEQCAAAGVPCFVKQLGANPRERLGINPQDSTFRFPGIHNAKGGNPDEWPDDLRVRQFPAISTAR